MSRAATTTDPKGADADASPPSPLSLNEVEDAGAVRFGRRVQLMILVMEDGRRVRIELPLAAAVAGQATKDWKSTKSGREILRAMAEANTPMKAQTIAKLAKLTYSGSFRQTMKGLEIQGELTKDEEELYVLAEPMP